MTRSRLTRQQMVDLWGRGINQAEIAERSGVSRQRVQQLMKSVGYGPRPSSRDAIRLLVSEGLNAKEIAIAAGMNLSAVYSTATNHGIRLPSMARKLDRTGAIEAFRRGDRVKDIAQKHGVNAQTVFRWSWASGLRRRK